MSYTGERSSFIINYIPAISNDPQHQCHIKNIRDEDGNYTRQLKASPPIFKAYNCIMGGVDRHDKLVGQHAIPLKSKRGYIKSRVFLKEFNKKILMIHANIKKNSKILKLKLNFSTK